MADYPFGDLNGTRHGHDLHEPVTAHAQRAHVVGLVGHAQADAVEVTGLLAAEVARLSQGLLDLLRCHRDAQGAASLAALQGVHDLA